MFVSRSQITDLTRRIHELEDRINNHFIGEVYLPAFNTWLKFTEKDIKDKHKGEIKFYIKTTYTILRALYSYDINNVWIPVTRCVFYNEGLERKKKRIENKVRRKK